MSKLDLSLSAMKFFFFFSFFFFSFFLFLISIGMLDTRGNWHFYHFIDKYQLIKMTLFRVQSKLDVMNRNVMRRGYA